MLMHKLCPEGSVSIRNWFRSAQASEIDSEAPSGFNSIRNWLIRLSISRNWFRSVQRVVASEIDSLVGLHANHWIQSVLLVILPTTCICVLDSLQSAHEHRFSLNLLNHWALTRQIEYAVHEIVIWTPLRTFGGETNTLSHCPALNSPCGARKSIQVSHFWSVNLNFSTYRTVLKNLRGEQVREGYLWTFYSL